jgi:hypothetical protein
LTYKLAWHFMALDANGRPVMRDGRHPPPAGEWLHHSGDIVICERGLHASYNALDALSYAPGPYVTRVAVKGDVVAQDDKLVCRSRHIKYGFDATSVLRAFARQQALSCIGNWLQPVPEVVLKWLNTGDEQDRAAAESAAESAARAAARAAANKQLTSMLLKAAKENGK